MRALAAAASTDPELRTLWNSKPAASRGSLLCRDASRPRRAQTWPLGQDGRDGLWTLTSRAVHNMLVVTLLPLAAALADRRHDGLSDRSSRPEEQARSAYGLHRGSRSPSALRAAPRLGRRPDRARSSGCRPRPSTASCARLGYLVEQPGSRKRSSATSTPSRAACSTSTPRSSAGSSDGPGHRPTGDCRRRPGAASAGRSLHVAIDDATMLVYAEIVPDEKARRVATTSASIPDWHAGRHAGIGARAGVRRTSAAARIFGDVFTLPPTAAAPGRRCVAGAGRGRHG